MEIGQKVAFRNWLSRRGEMLRGTVKSFFMILEEPAVKVTLDKESAEMFGSTEAGPLLSSIDKGEE